jgi:hypothetical protein
VTELVVRSNSGTRSLLIRSDDDRVDYWIARLSAESIEATRRFYALGQTGLGGFFDDLAAQGEAGPVTRRGRRWRATCPLSPPTTGWEPSASWSVSATNLRFVQNSRNGRRRPSSRSTPAGSTVSHARRSDWHNGFCCGRKQQWRGSPSGWSLKRSERRGSPVARTYVVTSTTTEWS